VQFSDSTLNNPTSWSWTFPGGTPSTSTLENPVVVYNTPGSFNNVTLVVTNAAGTDSITKYSYISISPGIAPTVSLSKNDTLCAGQIVTLTSSNGNGFLWYPGNQTGQSIPASSTGSFAVKVTDAFGCSRYSDTVDITVFPLPPTPVITQSGDTLFSSSLTGNQWYHNSVAIAGADSQLYVITDPGPYYVVVTSDSTGCSSYSSTIVGIDEDQSSGNSVSIAPNPSNGITTLTLNSIRAEQAEIKIYDAQGKLVLEKLVNVNGTTLQQLDLRNYGVGAFYIAIRQGNYTHDEVIIVQ
jgi:PKD repeat protein